MIADLKPIQPTAIKPKDGIKMNRKVFYSAIRKTIFGQITQQQVDGIETILNEWDSRGIDDLRWLAYILATTYHETAHTMQPIEEYGKGRKHEYGKPDSLTGKCYFGRGYVQLTWKRNYQIFSDRLGIDLVGNPDLALNPSLAVKILFDGMIGGLYTGVGLPKYFGNSTDWDNARRIVNGTDRMQEIAGYAKAFYSALQAASSFSPDEQVTESIVTTTDGEEIVMLEHEHPQPSPQQPVAEPLPEQSSFLSGKKTHIGMFISGGIGVAAMMGFIPGMTADTGAQMLQSAFGVSGFRSALPGLIKLAFQFYLRSKTV